MSSEKKPAVVLGCGSKFYDCVFITFIFGRCGKVEVMDFFLSVKTSALHPCDNLNSFFFFFFVRLHFQTLEEPRGLAVHEKFCCRLSEVIHSFGGENT